MFVDLHLETCIELSRLLAADALHALLYCLFLHGNNPITVTSMVKYELGLGDDMMSGDQKKFRHFQYFSANSFGTVDKVVVFHHLSAFSGAPYIYIYIYISLMVN